MMPFGVNNELLQAGAAVLSSRTEGGCAKILLSRQGDTVINASSIALS